MDFIKQWSFCICISLIISVFFSLLTPSGTLKRFFKVLIAVFIFISFILPFKDFKGFDFDFSKIGITDELRISQNENTEQLINSEISTLLADKGIVGFSVSSDARYDTDSGEIEIKDIQIAVPDDCNRDEVQKLVFDNLGLNARVINIGD